MASHSQSSSLADVDYDYYTYSHSASSSLTNGSVHPPATVLLQDRPSQAQVQQPVRKQTSLAQISVPSFSAFRSQVSSIPVLSPNGVRRRQPTFPAHSPRAHSLSIAEKASPRLVDPATRPLSVDSPTPQQLTGLAGVVLSPLTEETGLRQEER